MIIQDCKKHRWEEPCPECRGELFTRLQKTQQSNCNHNHKTHFSKLGSKKDKWICDDCGVHSQ